MAITRQKKEKILENLKGILKNAKVVVFVNFHGLSVASATQLRRSLRKIGVSYSVAKKTLIKKASEGLGFSGEFPGLEGEIAVAVSEEDSIELARALKDFAKKNKVLKLAGGIFENNFIGPEMVETLASIPPREILLAQIVNIINSPIQGLVVALNEIAKKK